MRHASSSVLEEGRFRVLRWGTYDMGKPRTRILRDGLRAVGATFNDCNRAVWEGIEDKSQVSGIGRRMRLLLRWLGSYPRLLWRFLRAPRPDIVLAGFPGVLDVILLAPFARLRGVPLVWDMFMSLYDTVVLDRKMIGPRSLLARLLHWVEGCALRRADLVFLDTEAHARRIETLYGLPAMRCGAVLVGVEMESFRPPRPSLRAAQSYGSPLQVLFYGQFIPLHGIDTIVSAARLTREDPIEWTLIGRGQQAKAIRRMIDAIPLPKLRWIEWVAYAELNDWITRADICLGIFGTSEKAACVIPNKVFQIVAAGVPLITRDSPAIRELLGHSPPCAYLIPAGQPEALVEALHLHMRHPVTAVPDRCHAPLANRISAQAIGAQFVEMAASRLGRALG